MVNPLMFPVDDIPEVRWVHGDDLCDCTFVRIGMWTNPYTAQTKEYRFCCMWAELEKMFPQFVRDIPGYWDENAKKYVREPAEWNGEDDMPAEIWHRQIQTITGRPLDEIRRKAPPPPKGVKRGD